MTADRQTNRFLFLYALACAGGAVAYVPFLSILLPVKVSALAGQGSDATWIAYMAFAGAVVASLGGIGFGYLSDITLNRRGWTGLGLILSSAMLLAVSQADGLISLLALVVGWQICLNLMLAPLTAWAADCIPDAKRGLLGGLLAFAPAMGALAGALITSSSSVSPDGRLGLVVLIVIACVLPVLIVGGPQPVKEKEVREPAEAALGTLSATQAMWISRLFVQVAQAALFSFLFFWLRSIESTVNDWQTASVFGAIPIGSVPLALMVGRWADRNRSPRIALIGCALLASLALIAMALAKVLPLAIAAYGLFGFATSVFLALHSAHTLTVLPRADRRARDLGLFNLTNTLPSLIMPWLTLALVPQFGFSGLFVLLSLLALSAGLVLGAVGRRF
jgi:MFS family permease